VEFVRESYRGAFGCEIGIQRIKQQLHISGTDTQPPTLRHSCELFVTYDDLQGGSAVPGVIMTEQSTMFMQR